MKSAIVFVLSTFLFSWILWTPSVLEYFELISLGSTSETVYFVAIVLGAFGPAFGSYVALRYQGKSFKAHLKQFFSRDGITWSWFLFILAVPLLINGLALLIGMAFALEIPGARIPSILLYLPYLLFVSILGGGQEEIGWRGFLQEELLERFNFYQTSAIIGLIWALWHIPIWFMLHDEHYITPFLAFTIMTISISFVYSLIFEGTGNKMLLLLFHGSNNAAHAVFYVQYLDQPASEQPLYWIYVAVNMIAVLFVLVYRSYKNKN